ncbi:NAD-dependent epimerase/dehydratase family protein, partial [Lactococcus lactis]|uniref:NAD-dependent epimerase/dehydratase family protein n=2 Tax=Bacteria TaxID=2 RepID=UPI003D122581
VSNPVGRFARSTTQGLVSVAMNAIISGRPITLFGDGSNVRDLVDADDVADALIMSCFDTDWHGATWNIGSGAGISNREVLELVGRITGKPVPL